MKIPILSLFLIVITSLSFSAGIPIDSNGNITVAHLVISISETQQKYLELHRELFLTKEQKTVIGKHWEFDNIDIVDPHHSDCTCGMSFAIWISPNKIAFITEDSYFETEPNSISANYETSFSQNSPSNSLYIGVSGNMYYNGKQISINEIKNLFKKLTTVEKKYLLVYQPPKNNNAYWNLIEKLKKQITKANTPDLKIVWL